jgi:iron-sulfur cluster repair protein YtfE (RIC family)
MNELFDQFESEFLLTRDQQIEEAEREQKITEEKVESQHGELQQSSAKSKTQEQKRPIIK